MTKYSILTINCPKKTITISCIETVIIGAIHLLLILKILFKILDEKYIGKASENILENKIIIMPM
jgi:hypothetical protein